MTMHTIWLLVDWFAIIFLLVMIGVAASRPAERSFLPGLLMIGVGIVGTLLRELGIIPRRFWLEARIVYLAIAILGLVLMERVWAKRRTSSSSHRPP
jgi:hypothetical protein